MDDINVYGTTFDKENATLEMELKIFQDYNLSLNMKNVL